MARAVGTALLEAEEPGVESRQEPPRLVIQQRNLERRERVPARDEAGQDFQDRGSVVVAHAPRLP
jgi:hypothetical protein